MTDLLTLSSPERLEQLLQETQLELEAIGPKIAEMEQLIEDLQQLKRSRQRLLTLKMSLTAMLEGISNEGQDPMEMPGVLSGAVEQKVNETTQSYEQLSAHNSFVPDLALKQVATILKQQDSLNYHMFKAVVLSGGKATTDEIRQYLIMQDLKQPQTGESFENAPLAEISSRANYLVRKGVLKPYRRGSFYSTLGWALP